MQSGDGQHRLTEDQVREDLQRRRHIQLALAENALSVAESLRDNYFRNTARFITDLRKALARKDPIMQVTSVEDADWSEMQGEVVTFIDGGIGQVRVSSQVPILLRVGSYCVRTGERNLIEREHFGYYPVILGDLEGGSKERKDFPDIVRITAELLGGLSALERTPDLRVLMFHGPLVYLMGGYAGHMPFTERDIDLFLHQYGQQSAQGAALKADFLREAALDIYPAMTDRSDEWVQRRIFEPIAWIAFLYRRLCNMARTRTPIPIIAGVVERGGSREFCEQVLLERVFRGLRTRQQPNYFNTMYGRTDLGSPTALLNKLGYTDSLLLAMLLRPGQYSEPWLMAKYAGLREEGKLTLPGSAGPEPVRWAPLRAGAIGFPAVQACYLQVSDTTEPVRVEVFNGLGEAQIEEATRHAYLYSRLLPGYGFPVGLNIADTFAHVPAWLTDAYGKLIRFHLGVSLQRGEISDAEMRRILVQAIYMTHRDWLFRPGA